MGCKFCASTGIPFGRNLEAGEIVEQLLAIQREEGVRILNIVFMGTPDFAQKSLEAIYNEIHTEPQDAYIIEEPFQVVPDVSGVDFAITMDEAKQILQEELLQ